MNNRNHNPYHQSFFKKKLSSTLLIEIATPHEETHLLLKQTQPVLVKFKRFLIYFSWLFEFKRFPVKIFVYVRFFLTVVSKGEQPWLLERSFGEESMSRGGGRERERRFREFFFFKKKRKQKYGPVYFASTNIYLDPYLFHSVIYIYIYPSASLWTGNRRLFSICITIALCCVFVSYSCCWFQDLISSKFAWSEIECLRSPM